MRNYIHLNLFVSFMLRAVAVLAKDILLFSDDETIDCSTQPSLVTFTHTHTQTLSFYSPYEDTLFLDVCLGWLSCSRMNLGPIRRLPDGVLCDEIEHSLGSRVLMNCIEIH